MATEGARARVEAALADLPPRDMNLGRVWNILRDDTAAALAAGVTVGMGQVLYQVARELFPDKNPKPWADLDDETRRAMEQVATRFLAAALVGLPAGRGEG
jgi:hypothetical protein